MSGAAGPEGRRGPGADPGDGSPPPSFQRITDRQTRRGVYLLSLIALVATSTSAFVHLAFGARPMATGLTFALVLLLVSDVVMPGRSGPELYRELLALRPGLPALFMSGYPGVDGIVPLERDRPASFIAKPFTTDALTAAVRGLLGEARGTGAWHRRVTRGPGRPRERDVS